MAHFNRPRQAFDLIAFKARNQPARGIPAALGVRAAQERFRRGDPVHEASGRAHFGAVQGDAVTEPAAGDFKHTIFNVDGGQIIRS